MLNDMQDYENSTYSLWKKESADPFLKVGKPLGEEPGQHGNPEEVHFSSGCFLPYGLTRLG